MSSPDESRRDTADRDVTVRSKSASRATTVLEQADDHDEKTVGSIEKASDGGLHGGEGESAFPEDKRFEALERIHRDWQHDAANPRNWSFGKKWTCAAVVSFYTFVSPVSSSMMAPALPQIADHYSISSISLLNMTLTIFLLAYALGPLVLSPMSELWGRKWVLHISNVFFLAFNLACAFAPNTSTLIVFRFFAGLGGSAPIAIGGGVIGDMFAENERAAAMAIFTLGPLIGPSVGPVAGGFIAETIGFKWIFVVIAVASALGGVVGIPLLNETYAPIIQLRRAKKQSNDTEGRSIEHDLLLERHQSVYHIIWLNLTRPIVLLSRSFICFILSVYMGIMYGFYYLMFATFPVLYQNTYGFSTGVAGLAYLGPGIGFALSTFYGAYFADGIYKKLVAKNGGVSKPEMRIPPLIPASFVVPIGLLWYGWSAQAKAHFIVPIIGAGVFSFAMMGTFLPIQLYLVDSFQYAASAIAAATVIRSLFGFVFPLFGEQMFDALGNGGGYSLLAGLAIVIGIPFPIWIYYYGERIRAKSDLSR